MTLRTLLLLPLLLAAASAFAADGDEQAIRAADARYWQAYNACDFDAYRSSAASISPELM